MQSVRRRFLVMAAVAMALLSWETWGVLSVPAALQQRSIAVEIPPQQSVLQITATLRQAGAIRSPEGFVVLGLVRGSLGSLKAGEYEVPRGATTLEVLALLEGGRVRPHPVLHPEGAIFA